MTTILEGPLKRELTIAGKRYTLTITPAGFKLVPKGKRKGLEMDWQAFLSGDHALSIALTASLNDRPIDSPTKGAARQRSTKKRYRAAAGKAR